MSVLARLPMSKSQIDLLGDRLRAKDIVEADVRLLSAFRDAHAPALDAVVQIVRIATGLVPTSRPSKSTDSIREKLRRQPTRLSQMQDVAGCRLTLDNVRAQNDAATAVAAEFRKVRVDDSRDAPLYGYRAVHLIVSDFGVPIEIQLRTQLQDRWAQLSEKLALTVDRQIKYGGGPQDASDVLSELSEAIAYLEALQLGMRVAAPNGAYVDMLNDMLADDAIAPDALGELFAGILNLLLELWSKEQGDKP